MAEVFLSIILRNRYRVIERLGAGGAGTVYKVADLFAGPSRGEGRPLALKAVFGAITDGEAVVPELLRHEFRSLAVLRHPLIARVYDFGRIPERSALQGSHGRSGYFFTRDLIEGQDLKAYCKGLGVPQICRVCQLTAEVLDVLHRSGVVHGDFKPANVIVAPDGRPHLIDFGLMRTEGHSFGSSGTTPYLAPEILHGQQEDRRADLYSLGVSIYRLLTKHLPMRDASVEEIARWHRRRGQLSVSKVRQVPRELDRLVQRLTDPNPERRFPSAAEAALALAEVAAKTGDEPIAPSARHFVPPAPGRSLVEPLQSLEATARRRLFDRTGGPVLLAVEGEVGAGKSTLLQELAWRLQLRGAEVLHGEFRSGDMRAYGLWRDLLDQVTGLTKLPHPLETLGVLDTPYGLIQKIGDYLGRSSDEVPLLLLLDNGEQASEEDRAVLRFLSHTLDPQHAIMLVVAFRTQGLQELDQDLLQDLGHPPHVTLEPLSLDDISRMVSDASGRSDAELSARLQQVTGGNPLFVMEMLEQLDQEGWPVNPDLGRMPPLGVEQLYTRRFSSLPETCQSVLEALAVVGRPTGVSLLQEMAAEAHGEHAPAQIAADLEQLQRDKWLDHELDETFRFQRGQVARMLYQQIPPQRRRALHLAVATVLDREGGHDLVEWTRHAIDAQELGLALRTFEQAVAFLQGFGAQQSAMQLYEGMLQLLEQTPHHDDLKRRTRRELGELYCAVGDYARAKKELKLSHKGSEADEIHDAGIALARVHRLTGELDQALDLLDQVLQDQPSLPDQVAALAEKAEVNLALDAHDQVLEMATRALKLHDKNTGAGDPKAVAQLHGLMAMSLQLHGRPEEARQSWEMALTEARAYGDRREEANILNRWAVAAIRQGELTQVSHLYRSALECAQQIGDVERVATIQFNLATYHLIQGELGACLEHLPRCVRLFEAIGARKNIAHGYNTLGPLQYRLGLYEQAWVTLKKALDAARRLGSQRLEAVALANSALVQAERGHYEQARRNLAGALELFDGLGWPMETADAMLDLAEVELVAGDSARALEVLGSARRGLGQGLRQDLEIRAAVLEARAVAMGGTVAAFADADAALEGALVAAGEIGSHVLTWRCHAAAVELFDASHRPELADQHMTAALEILERVAEDLPPDVRLAFWQSPLRRSLRERAARVVKDRGEITSVETAELDALDYEPETVKQGPLATRSTMTLISNLDGLTRKDPTRR